jgi:cytochrome c5
MDTLLANAITGINAMPAKGLCFTCTDDDLKDLIQYMVDSSQ